MFATQCPECGLKPPTWEVGSATRWVVDHMRDAHAGEDAHTGGARDV